MDKIKHKCLWFSLALYATGFAFPAYYIGNTHEPQNSSSLLLMGWLGPLDGHFSWFANLFFFIALLKYKKENSSSVFGILALIFALSFLGHEKIVVSALPQYKSIVAYGYGYFLWVSAIGLFTIAQLFSANFNNISKKNLLIKSILCVGWLGICTSVFVYHYYIREGSQNSLKLERNRVFTESCKNANYSIFIKNEKTDSIYFDPDGAVRIKKRINGKWYREGSGVLGLPLLNSGMIKYYETVDRNYSASDNYRRFFPKDRKGLKIVVLESKHVVITEVRDFAKNLDIRESNITIKNLKSNQVIAKVKYVLDRTNGRFCNGRNGNYFSTSKFVREALNLDREYQSVYD